MLDLLKLISIQVISESFTVSSSGHIKLMECLSAHKLVSLSSSLFAMLEMPEIQAWQHVPTIVVVAMFFAREWLFLLFHLQYTWRMVIRLILYMVLSNSITTIFFLLIHRYPFVMPLWIGFGITAGILLSLRWCRHPSYASLNTARSATLGCVQGVALLPGISRFAVVFAACRWMGISNRRAFFITWMLQWPLVLGMLLVQLRKYYLYPTHLMTIDPYTLGYMITVSAAAFAGMCLMYCLVRRGRLWIMSIYMILPFILSLLYCL